MRFLAGLSCLLLLAHAWGHAKGTAKVWVLCITPGFWMRCRQGGEAAPLHPLAKPCCSCSRFCARTASELLCASHPYFPNSYSSAVVYPHFTPPKMNDWTAKQDEGKSILWRHPAMGPSVQLQKILQAVTHCYLKTYPQYREGVLWTTRISPGLLAPFPKPLWTQHIHLLSLYWWR